MREPHLIQRCTLRNGSLEYDYMGSAEFEIGDQAKSLRRIFGAGLSRGRVEIKVCDKTVPVRMIAGEGFSFGEYQMFLQLVADGSLRLMEPSYFDQASRVAAGISPPARIDTYKARINVWFDFRNDVLWTLTKQNMKVLAQALEDIKKYWRM